MEGTTTAVRVLGVQAVETALSKLDQSVGDARWAARIIRRWASAGTPTPMGQRLLPGVVKGALASFGPGLVEDEANDAHCVLNTRMWPTTPLTKRALELSGTNKRPRTSSNEDSLQKRESKEKQISELVEKRLQEVLQEITTHMEEILSRLGSSSWQQWHNMPESCARADLFAQLVHSVQEPEVGAPPDLRAELLPHQLEGLEWLVSLYVNNLHGILADEMGLGKTIQTIALVLFLQDRKGDHGPHLIVAPKSTLANWQAEFNRFAPGYPVHLLTGDQESREAELDALRRDIEEGRGTVCVTNYEQVHRNSWLITNQWHLVVVDEGHRLKNPETVLHNTMTQMKCQMRLLLTGTPIQNKVGELWALLHYLLPDLFTCMMDFRSWFARPFQGIPGLNEYDLCLSPEQEEQVVSKMHSLLSPFLLQRLKHEVLGDSLPPRVEVTVRVPLSSWQRTAYKDLERRTIRLMTSDGSLGSEQVNNALMQLRRVVLHPYLFQETYKKDRDLYRTSGKLEALDRLLNKLLCFDHKVLIFSQFTSVLDILEDFLVWRGLSKVRLDGQVSHEQRAERIARFSSDPDLRIFLLSSRAGGLGLNLQAADTVVLFDLDWNPQNDKQAIARAHRVGQTKEVRVVRLLSNSPIETHMERRCQEKLDLERKVMGAGMFRRQATSDQRRQALQAVLGLVPDPEHEVGTSPGAERLTPLDELNRLAARSEKELAVFRKMDAEMMQREPEALDEPVHDDEPTEQLVGCGRLMLPEEAPRGFSIS